MRSLTQSELVPNFSMPTNIKVSLFNLVPEYSVAAFQAASIASKAQVVVTVPNDSFVIDRQLLLMLYLDYLVFGYATFEIAGDVIVYSDPRQFQVPSVTPDGIPSVKFGDSEISSRVGVIPRCPNPFGYCKSVPELIPQVFLFLISFYSKLFYDLSPFKKPDVLIITTETLSVDELATRRRKLIEQAEEDYGSFLLFTHSSEEKPQVVDLTKGESVGAALAEKLYDRQVELLNKTCGFIMSDQSTNYAVVQFYSAFENEIRRLMPDAEVSISLRGNNDG